MIFKYTMCNEQIWVINRPITSKIYPFLCREHSKILSYSNLTIHLIVLTSHSRVL